MCLDELIEKAGLLMLLLIIIQPTKLQKQTKQFA